MREERGKENLEWTMVWRHQFLNKVSHQGLAQPCRVPRARLLCTVEIQPRLAHLIADESQQVCCPRTNNVYSCRLHPYGRKQKRAFQSWLVNFTLCSVQCVGNTEAFSRWHHKVSSFLQSTISFLRNSPLFFIPLGRFRAAFSCHKRST